jgi:hypothetical protein
MPPPPPPPIAIPPCCCPPTVPLCVIMKSLNVGYVTSYNDQVLSFGNILKMSNIHLGYSLFDLMKNNMREEFVIPWCKRLFVRANFRSKKEMKVQLLCNREKNQDKKLES